MLKKMTILALAVTAFAAVSASTASAKWTDKGVALPSGTNPQIQFLGQAAFTSAVVGGIECETTSTATFTGGTTTGTIDSFHVNSGTPTPTVTEKCITTGPLAPCAVKSAQATGLPWTLHSNGADAITITTGQIHNVLETSQGGACGVAQSVTLEPGTVTATIPAGQTSAVTQVHLSGQLETSTKSKVTVSGTQTIQAPNAGTYGTA